jgi:O-antigen ligase
MKPDMRGYGRRDGLPLRKPLNSQSSLLVITVTILIAVVLSLQPLIGLLVISAGFLLGILGLLLIFAKGTSVLLFLAAAFLWVGPIASRRIPALEILLLLIFLLFFLKYRSRLLMGIINTPGVLLLALFALGGVVSLVYSLGHITNLDGEIYVLVRSCLLSVLIYSFVANSLTSVQQYRNLRIFLLAAGTIFVLYVAFSLPEGGWNPVIRMMQSSRARRYYIPGYPGMAPATLLAQYTSLLVPFSLVEIIDGNTRFRRIFGQISLLSLIVVIFVLGTRFAWASTFLAVVVFTLAWTKGRIANRNSFLTVVSAIVFVALLSCLYQNDFLNVDLSRRVESVLNFSRVLEEDSFLYRISLWKGAIAVIAQSPLGKGYLYFLEHHVLKNPYTGIYVGYNVHNEFLSVALGTGWVGFIAIVLFLIGFVSRHVKYSLYAQRSVRAMAAAGLSLITVFIVDSMFDTFSTNYGALSSTHLFWFSAGIVIGSIRMYQKESSVAIGYSST